MSTSWLSTAQVRELNLGHGDKPDYFSIKGFVSFFKKDNCLYQVTYCVAVSKNGKSNC